MSSRSYERRQREKATRDSWIAHHQHKELELQARIESLTREVEEQRIVIQQTVSRFAGHAEIDHQTKQVSILLEDNKKIGIAESNAPKEQALRSTLHKKDDEIAILTKQVAQGTEDIEGLRSTLHKKDDEIAMLTKQVAQGTEDIEGLRSTLHKKDDEIAMLSKQVAQGTEDIEVLSSSIFNNGQEVDWWKRQAEDSARNVAELNSSVETKEQELKQLKRKLEESVESVSEGKTNMRIMQRSIKKLEDQLRENEKEMDVLAERIRKCQCGAFNEGSTEGAPSIDGSASDGYEYTEDAPLTERGEREIPPVDSRTKKRKFGAPQGCPDEVSSSRSTAKVTSESSCISEKKRGKNRSRVTPKQSLSSSSTSQMDNNMPEDQARNQCFNTVPPLALTPKNRKYTRLGKDKSNAQSPAISVEHPTSLRKEMTAEDFPQEHRSKASLKIQAVATFSSAGGIKLNIQSAFTSAIYIRLALYPNSRATQPPQYLGIRVLHPATSVRVDLTAEQASMWLQTTAGKRSPTPSLRVETSHDPREWAIVVPPRLADAHLPGVNHVGSK